MPEVQAVGSGEDRGRRRRPTMALTLTREVDIIGDGEHGAVTLVGSYSRRKRTDPSRAACSPNTRPIVRGLSL